METKNKKEWRYERKFIIPKMEIGEVRQLVKLHPAMIKEEWPKRNVNNIYLDSSGFSNYHENLSGNAQRHKIRIRWYGKIFGQIKKPVLEIKIKSAELGKKQTYKLKPFKLDKNFSWDSLMKVFEESKLPEKIMLMLKMSKPTLLNSYEREYYRTIKHEEKNTKKPLFRITLDYNLSFYHIKEKNNSFKEKHLEKERVILEVKYNQEKDFQAPIIINQFPFRLTASSKYVYGIDILSL